MIKQAILSLALTHSFSLKFWGQISIYRNCTSRSCPSLQQLHSQRPSMHKAWPSPWWWGSLWCQGLSEQPWAHLPGSLGSDCEYKPHELPLRRKLQGGSSGVNTLEALIRQENRICFCMINTVSGSRNTLDPSQRKDLNVMMRKCND